MSLRAGRSLSSRINALLIAPGDTGAETALGYGAAHIHTLVLAAIFPLFSMTTAVQTIWGWGLMACGPGPRVCNLVDHSDC